MTKYLSSMCKAPGSIPNTTRKKGSAFRQTRISRYQKAKGSRADVVSSPRRQQPAQSVSATELWPEASTSLKVSPQSLSPRLFLEAACQPQSQVPLPGPLRQMPESEKVHFPRCQDTHPFCFWVPPPAQYFAQCLGIADKTI